METSAGAKTKKSPSEYRYSTYSFDYDKVGEWKAYLENNGFVVVKQVIPKQEAESAVSEIWALLEAICGLVKANPSTLENRRLYPYMVSNSIVQYIGHSEVQWRLRELCAPLFAALFSVPVTDLLTSFDGFGFASRHNSSGECHIADRLHTDQHPSKAQCWSYQGLLNLLPNDSKAGGFVCVPKSHTWHHEYFNTYNPHVFHRKGHFYRFTPDEKRCNQQFFNAVKINAGPGDFVLWDSRTFHCNTDPREDQLRVCTYICMMPKYNITQENMAHRRQALAQRLNTYHHPLEPQVLYPQQRERIQHLLPNGEILRTVNCAEVEQNPLRKSLAIGE